MTIRNDTVHTAIVLQGGGALGADALDGGLEESEDALAQVETVRATAIRDLATAFAFASR